MVSAQFCTMMGVFELGLGLNLCDLFVLVPLFPHARKDNNDNDNGLKPKKQKHQQQNQTGKNIIE